METHPDPLLDLHEQLRQNVLRYMEATAQRSRLQAEMDASLSSLVAAGLAGASSTKVLSGDLDMVGSLWSDRTGWGQIREGAAPWSKGSQALQSGGSTAGAAFDTGAAAAVAGVSAVPQQQLHGLQPSPAHLGWA